MINSFEEQLREARVFQQIIGLVGVIIGAGITLAYNFYRDRREREEKYKFALYAKRLEVYQKAYYHVESLSDKLIYELSGLGDPGTKNVVELCREAKDFYNSNCLYLDEQSRNKTIRAIFKIEGFIEHSEALEVVIERLSEARDAIVKGMGAKHLEQAPEKKQVKQSQS